MREQRKETVRVHVRLQKTTAELLEHTCQKLFLTKTEAVVQGLAELVHDLQTRPTTNEIFIRTCMNRLARQGQSIEYQFKIPRVITDFIKLNQLNLTTCLTIAIHRKWQASTQQ